MYLVFYVPKVKKKIIIGVLIIIILLGVLIYVVLQKNKTSRVEPQVEIPLTEEVAEPFKAGEVGEVSEEEMKEKGISSLSPVVFNTSGVISEVKSDRLIVQGSGSNFSDQQPRELTLIFTDSTIINDPAKKSFYKGLKGLEKLKPGAKISIEGIENIRGKTEFKVSGINILQ